MPKDITMSSHVFMLYAPADHDFVYHLAVQLEQRGLVVWPVPDPTLPQEILPNKEAGLAQASHVIGIFSQAALASEAFCEQCVAACADKTMVGVIRQAVKLPDELANCPLVDFQKPFLLAVEALVKRLKAADAPFRPPPERAFPMIDKPELLPIAMPAERCWRDDRLRINYRLPVLLSQKELEERLPAFFALARFELSKSSRKRIRGWRMREFRWFDPRRAEQTITVQRRKGGLRVYYRMTRVQVYYWFPAHYHTLNREAAALYRYLVTGQLDEELLAPVHRQARRARTFSWVAVVSIGVILALIFTLLLF